MTSTNFNEFKKLFDKIPKERLSYVRFIPLRQDKKVPECSGSWKDINLNYYEIKNRMGMGGNIGVVALPRGIMVVDLDTNDKKELLSISLAEELFYCNTFTVQTRSKGLHFYFLNNGGYNTQTLIIDNLEAGELRANWGYVLSPGSWVNIDKYEGGYTVVQDKPIKPFPAELEKYFEKGVVKERNEMIKGKQGKTISEKTKRIMEEYYRKKDMERLDK